MQRGVLSRLFLPAASFARGLGLPVAAAAAIHGLKMPVPALAKGSAEAARGIYRGQFHFAGQTVDAGGASVFARVAPSEAWAGALHDFHWLGHLAAQGGALDRILGRNLILDWLAHRRQHPASASSPEAAARRLIHMVRHGGFLLDGASAAFETGFKAMAARDIGLVASPARRGSDVLPALALAYAANGLRGAETHEAAALTRLDAALAGAVLPDGCHASRSPAKHLALLLDLLPLRLAMGARRAAIPQSINAVIERMIPMLRFFALGDGGLALFHGTGQPMTADVKAALDADTVFGRPLGIARYGHFARLAHGKTAVVFDTGMGGASDSALAFEMSDGAHRVVVNCGMPANPSAAWARSAGLAAAHSTAEFDQGATTAIAPARYSSDAPGSMTGASRRAETVVHDRDVFLSADGGDLRGEDRFMPDGGSPDRAFAIRFHLHPAVKATLAKNGASAVLQLPDRAGWKFNARGADLMIEESVYFGAACGPRRAEQIVMRGNARLVSKVNWAFRRIEKRERADGKKSDNPRLPF